MAWLLRFEYSGGELNNQLFLVVDEDLYNRVKIAIIESDLPPVYAPAPFDAKYELDLEDEKKISDDVVDQIGEFFNKGVAKTYLEKLERLPVISPNVKNGGVWIDDIVIVLDVDYISQKEYQKIVESGIKLSPFEKIEFRPLKPWEIVEISTDVFWINPETQEFELYEGEFTSEKH